MEIAPPKTFIHGDICYHILAKGLPQWVWTIKIFSQP